MTNFETIRGLIQNSALSTDDKQKLIDVFADMPDEALLDTAKLLEKDSTWIEKISENRKKKEEALTTGNMDLWNEIIQEEKQYLTDLTYDLD
jgi:hypothetical protein